MHRGRSCLRLQRWRATFLRYWRVGVAVAGQRGLCGASRGALPLGSSRASTLCIYLSYIIDGWTPGPWTQLNSITYIRDYIYILTRLYIWLNIYAYITCIYTASWRIGVTATWVHITSSPAPQILQQSHRYSDEACFTALLYRRVVFRDNDSDAAHITPAAASPYAGHQASLAGCHRRSGLRRRLATRTRRARRAARPARVSVA